jgi:phospholipid/cholesterol/gamma-HCH transport system permease protein
MRQARVTTADASATDGGPAIATTTSGRFVTRGELASRALAGLASVITPNARRRPAPLAAGVMREVDAIGVGAIRLVVASAILVGLITVFQVAYQLAPYGAEVMSARALAWFVAREIGPVVVAILIVARSAAAIAGEFASMNANGETDALRVMGLDPVKYLVVPKLAALLIALPLLTSLAIALAVVGGWLGTSVVLGYNTGLYLEHLHDAFATRDVAVGLIKSVVFALIIGLTAADEGLAVARGRISGIGTAATRAVVHCLIGVLAADTVVNAIVYFIPGLT